jgi:hypothetical protein
MSPTCPALESSSFFARLRPPACTPQRMKTVTTGTLDAPYSAIRSHRGLVAQLWLGQNV